MGICLGHQSIGYAFGAEVVRASRIMHGKTSPIINDGKTIFAGLPILLPAGRYHSLLVDRKTLPACFEISAETAEGGNYGIAAQRVSGGRHSVSSGIGADATGQTHHQKLF